MNDRLPDLAPHLDHTLLDRQAGRERVEALCDEADRWGCAAVCVYPVWVPVAVERLYRKPPKVATVIGFPSGAHTPAVKRYEAAEAVDRGATELDVVINLAWLREGNTQGVYEDLAAIVEAAGQPVKAILELPLLTPTEVEQAVAIALDAGVAGLKTGTGWSGPVTVPQVEQLVRLTQGRIPIKAAGGIRNSNFALELLAAGATRLGTSHTATLLQELAQAGRT